MSKRKPPSRKTRQATPIRPEAAEGRKPKHGAEASRQKRTGWHAPSPAAIRETVESVVIAFVLAFLFRTFEAEAFVIPTGSMAPTLMGRHKDLACPKCEYEFQVSASDEVDENGVSRDRTHWVTGCTCPICRYPMNLGPGDPHENYPSFKGDRILVGKFAYQFGDPEPWDVAVFKYPGGAKTNYIKRLVGLPGQTIRIHGGDIFVKGNGDGHFTIARKPPEKLLAMLQVVFDNDVMQNIAKYGWPDRWQPWPPSDIERAGDWRPSRVDEGAEQEEEHTDDGSFETEGTAEAEVWLRYRHLVPSYTKIDGIWKEDWQYLEDHGEPPPGFDKRLQLISDFRAYNSNRSAAAPSGSIGLHWVGDLAVACTLRVLSNSGQVVFELVEGGRPMRCRIDLSTGAAILSIGGEEPSGDEAETTGGEPYQPSAQTDVRGPGEYEIIFANCDDQLLLWVDGSVVEFDTATAYADLHNGIPKHSDEHPGLPSDLSPVGIGSVGAGLRVSHLKIFRDIYYIARRHKGGPNDLFTDFTGPRYPQDLLSDPDRWEEAFKNMREVTFSLGADQFLVLGDNSAKSKDSRLWNEEGFGCFVDRSLLIGKALYIYWPHSWDKVEVLGAEIPFPFFPNFARMGFVR